MDKKIIVSLFESDERARATADRLKAAGFDHDDISVIDQSSARARFSPRSTHIPAGATGAAYAPAAAGVGYPAMPVTPAAGMMLPAAEVVGAGREGLPAGGMGTSYASDRAAAEGGDDLADWLSDEGVARDDAQAYAEGVRQGGALLTVRCDEADVDRLVSIIDREEGARHR